MPKRKASSTASTKKMDETKEIRPDMDHLVPADALHTSVAARARSSSSNSQAVTEESGPPKGPGSDHKPKHVPGVSKLTDEQRSFITAELVKPDGLPMRAIARSCGATFQAVKHLADKTGARPDRKLRVYGRRLGKRLPIPERVDIYAEIARASLEDVTGGEKLRALERIDALDGIVTRREEKESESNQVHVGPLFVLPASASPVVDAVVLDVRPSQDKS